MCKVSIIVAAYNVKEYIRDTLNSATSQTLKDIEIVVVDDCSTDGTYEVLSECAALDKRIKLIRHGENKSVNISRMTGIQNACGEYIMFLDGDDTLAPNACERAYEAITEKNVDILQFDFLLDCTKSVRNRREAESGMKEAMRSATHRLTATSEAGLIDENAVGGIINLNLWDKIYKKTLLEAAAKHVPSEYLNMAEDVLFSFLIQYHAQAFDYIPDRLYSYRFGCGMSTTQKVNERILKSIAKNAYVYDYLCCWVKSVGKEKECETALARVRKKLYDHIVGAYLNHTEKDGREFFIKEVLKYGSSEGFILTLSEYFYKELEGYKNSESYRLGMIITFIPRKIKAFLIKLFRHK